MLRHNRREIVKDKNRTINGALTHLNYYLTPERPGVSELEYFKRRKEEVYCYGRDDVKVLAGWVCPLPIGISDWAKQKQFFEVTYSFLAERYGIQNVVQAVVHYDECIMTPKRDLSGKVLCDDSGQAEMEIFSGRPHLHFCFMPIVSDNNPKHTQAEKLCANEVLCPQELKNFHSDYQKYLEEHGIYARIANRMAVDNCPWADPKNDGEKSKIQLLREEIQKSRQWAAKK